MSTPAADPSRLQTRAKNATEHPGNVVEKRKRRGKVEMAAFREQQRLEQEEKGKVVKQKLQAAAKLEDIIAANDKKASAGVATKKGKPAISTTVAKKASVMRMPVHNEAPKYPSPDVDFDQEERNEVEMGSNGEDNSHEALADPIMDVDDGNVTDMGQVTEDEEPPKKVKKVERGDTREVIRTHRNAVMKVEKDVAPYKEPVSDKPTGVIENWTKDVLQGVTKPTTANARITSSATLVTKAKHDQKKSATSKAPLNHKKAAKAPTKLFTTASDEDFPDIRIAESDVLTPPASHGIVAVDSEGAGGSVDAAHQGKYTNADLPKGCQDKYLWRHVFIPTVYTYFAACPDPWSQNDNLVVGKLQLVWNKSFEDEPCVRHTILPSKAVFSVAAQRTCEWCAAFGSTALSFLNAFFATNPGFDTNEARVAFSTHQLQFFRFLYEFAEGDNKNAFRGLFLTAIVLQTFAHHFVSIAGAVNVAGLHDNGGEARGALALAAAAAERAYRFWTSGAITIESLAAGLRTAGGDAGKQRFSEDNWGIFTRTYLSTINTNLRGDSFSNIVARAQVFAKVGQRAGDLTMTAPSADPDLVDERAQLLDLADD